MKGFLVDLHLVHDDPTELFLLFWFTADWCVYPMSDDVLYPTECVLLLVFGTFPPAYWHSSKILGFFETGLYH